MSSSSAPSSNATLVVDFPATGRIRGIGLAGIAELVGMAFVRFASEIQGRYIPYPSSDENKAKWYDEQDYMRFESMVFRDAVTVSTKVLAAASVDQGSAQKLILRCIGFDHLISRDVPTRIRVVRESRKTHVQAVLMAQKMQRLYGIGGPEDLASISSESSLRSRERAYKVAIFRLRFIDQGQ